ncbi:stalk domain-containing protein [Paenibacillus bouchesdurhonensis]|uniref:stalk domain-containing protein n=1 Tax=Paenibacillus bouchesdurhonensis TaxID=1870990 RepID=UPI000DA6328C|nr:stalk domain-containing protein [Paenibacillus bouchesdurhonensis]
MKKTIHIIIALCLGMMIGMTTTALGAPIKETVQASFEKIKFVVNGEEKPLDADPLVYQGSTYLPVRTVLNTLGYDVGYKADTKTVTADKSLDAILSEMDSLKKEEGEQMDVSSNNSQSVEKQIETLNHLITRERELIENIETMIQESKKRTDVSEESKNERIKEFNERIERSNEIIKRHQDKLTELQK